MPDKSPFADVFDAVVNVLKLPSPEINIAMLGPRGSGKTSVLTAMYDRFDTVVGRINLTMRPGSDSVSAMLGERMTQLLQLVKDPAADAGIRGDMSHHTYDFAIGRRGTIGKTTSFRLLFHDYPGGWLAGAEGDPEAAYRRTQVVGMVRDAAVTQIAIDTPFLMEEGGRYHEERNTPAAIAEIFREAYQKRDGERLVILSPVKCEAYMQTAEDRQRLLDRVREGYAELLRVLEANVIGPKLMIAITPVQTTGCVVFSEMEPDPDSVPPVRARYKLKDGESTYQPRDSEQPLSYIMLFAMRQYKNDLNETPIRAALTRLFGLDAHIREGFELLAASCKASDGFSVRGI